MLSIDFIKKTIGDIPKSRQYYAFLTTLSGKILSLGLSDERTPYGLPSIHAEHSAISKLVQKNCPKHINLIVIRFNKCGNLKICKPCKHCILRLHRFVIKSKIIIDNIIYSNSDDTMTHTTLTKLIDEDDKHVSLGHRLRLKTKKIF